MYFWNITEFKEALAARPMTDREALPYLIIFVALFPALYSFGGSEQNDWDLLGSLLTFLFGVFGTILAYVQNGGTGGSDFIKRYLALSWVVGIRLFVMMVPIVIVILLVLERDTDTDSTTPLQAFIFAL